MGIFGGGGGGGGFPSFGSGGNSGGHVLPGYNGGGGDGGEGWWKGFGGGSNPYATMFGGGSVYGQANDFGNRDAPAPAAGAPSNGLAGTINADGPKKITDLQSLKDAMANGGNLGMSDLVSSMPMYSGIMGENGVMDPYKFDYSGSKGYQKMSDMAFSKGPTDMYQMEAGLIDQNTNKGVSDLQTQSAHGYGQGLGSLAMSGGLTGGARERLADSSQMNYLTGAQGIYGEGSRAKTSALLNDSARKNQFLSQVTGYDVNAENLNKNAAINDLYNKNQSHMAGWGKLGDIYGSGQAADAAMAAANRKDPGFLGINGLWDTIGSAGKGTIR